MRRPANIIFMDVDSALAEFAVLMPTTNPQRLKNLQQILTDQKLDAMLIMDCARENQHPLQCTLEKA